MGVCMECLVQYHPRCTVDGRSNRIERARYEHCKLERTQ